MSTSTIKFKDNDAKNIYDRTLSRAVRVSGKKKIEEMFSYAACSNGDDTLDVEEAKGVEELLNKYDKGLLVSLGIRFYNNREINAAYEEDAAWNKCLENTSDPGTIKDFISKYPSSEHIKVAYFILGRSYDQKSDFKNAIAAYTEQIKFFPEAKESTEALRSIVINNIIIGNYPGVLFNSNKFFSMDSDSMIVYFINKIMDMPWTSFYSSGTAFGRLCGLAEFFQNDQKDIKTAKRIYNQILMNSKYSQNNSFKGLIKLSQIALAEMESCELQTSESIAQFMVNVKYGGLLLYSDNDNYLKTAIFLILLSRNLKITNLYLGASLGFENVDCETKTNILRYFAVYQDLDGRWKIWGLPCSAPYMDLSGNIEKLKSFLHEMSQKENLQHVITRLSEPPTEYQSKILDASSYSDFNCFYGEYWPYFSSAIVELKRQGLCMQGNARLKSFNATFQSIKGQKSDEELAGMEEAFSLLPETHFKDLGCLQFEEKLSNGNAGDYNPGNKSIRLTSSSTRDAVHEIIHHWDDKMNSGNTYYCRPNIPNAISDSFITSVGTGIT